ncbi:MAG: hypothetical protein IPF58_01375 [Saprospirales bacterium]|nr:hypothetical protein [Saprospirales bacterium]
MASNVNGPIERAKNLLPQLKVEHRFDYDRMREGLFRIAWGVFKKAVIADRLSLYVDDLYLHHNEISGLDNHCWWFVFLFTSLLRFFWIF